MQIIPLVKNVSGQLNFQSVPCCLSSKMINTTWWLQGFESRWMSVKHVCYVNTVNFYEFYNFCRYNNLFWIMQYDNIRNLNREIFTQWKHLEYWVNCSWNGILWFTFKETRALSKYCNCLIHGVVKV